MTTQHYLDSIKQVFPQVPDTQILKDIDKAQKLFATEAGMLTTSASLSSVSTNFAWTLPTGFRRLLDVKMYDADGHPIYFGSEEAQISYEIALGKFYLKSLTSTPISVTPSGVSSIYLIYENLPTTITTQDTALEIEEEFRDAIEHWILKNYFAKYPMIGEGGVQMRDYNAVRYHQGEYERIKLKAKRYVNSKEKTLGDVQNYQDAGRVRLPERHYDSAAGSGTVTTHLTTLGDIYEKFALYNISTTDSGALTTATKVGYSTITATKTGATLALASTADFGTDTFIESNNAEVSWVYNSSSSITVTLPSSFSYLSIQLYEYL